MTTVKECPECKGTKIIQDYERGELICATCGLVISDSMVDEGPEWRAFDSDQRDKRARTGAPIKLMRPNKGLSTEIDQYNRDIRGVKINTKKQAQLYRMRKWHKRSSIQSSVERNLAIALTELDKIASYLGLHESIREEAALMYRRCIEKGVRGKNIEALVAAVIYAVCRQRNMPRTLAEIAQVSGVKRKDIGRTYRILVQELSVGVPLANPLHYVPRFVTALGLSGRVQETAMDILKEAIDRKLISGRGPTGLAAAAVYASCLHHAEHRTQKEVAEAAGITEVTIRNRFKELKDTLKLDLPEVEGQF